MTTATTLKAATAALALLATPSFAQDTQRYVENNLLAIFYHEMGHALIDVMQLPVFGQEEDAADVLSVYLIDAFFEEDAAVEMAYDTAFGFLNDAEETGDDIPFWAVHGPDIQRYYNLVCLFYGANPDERGDVAEELDLPEDRAETCPEEYELAADSWGPVLDEMENTSGKPLRFVPSGSDAPSAKLLDALMEAEVDDWNEYYAWPAQVEVRVIFCDEANAFYDPSERSIEMCVEYAEFLAETAPD
ncbi:MAG: DUF4344 domain-containing metallopeptidase [Pseudomonadota bacterium]